MTAQEMRPTAVSSVLDELELAAGQPLGMTLRGGLRNAAGDLDPVPALEDALRPLLARPPCVVAFSGGRDSSALLAVACRLAEREGLEPPVAYTMRFSEHAETLESDWQESLIAQLSVGDWMREEIGDELGLLEPLAQSVIEREGVLWPPNSHFVVPALRAAGHGSAVFGFDGDSVFGGWGRRRLAELRSRPWRVRPRDIRPIARWLVPSRIEQRLIEERSVARLAPDWLTEAAQREYAAVEAARYAAEPARWREWPDWLVRQRYIEVARESIRRVASAFDAELALPFLGDAFLASLSRRRGSEFADRSTAMASVFGGLLPESHLQRPTKASFDNPLWTPATREFADSWSGEGVPEAADPDLLAAEWFSEVPSVRASTPMQAAWLVARREEA